MTVSAATSPDVFDIVVVGGGPAGLASALLLVETGAKVALLRPLLLDPPQFARTTALLGASVDLMCHLKVWERLEGTVAPLVKMRLIDDRDHLLRSPTVTFSASELGLEAFGFNIPNGPLVEALEEVAAQTTGLTIIEGEARQVRIAANDAEIAYGEGGGLRARLVVGADGRNSLVRKISGIKTLSWAYPQAALTVNLTHQGEHQGISSEFHTATGPFTLVPLPGRSSSLVAVLGPDEAARLMADGEKTLCEEIERRSHLLLGRIKLASTPAVFPLGGHSAVRFGENRVALVGEAAHGVPPIGAQGLNLGLRDAIHLADQITRHGGDAGHPAILAGYHAARRRDVWLRTAAIDLVNRSLLYGFLPSDGVRGLALTLARDLPAVRRALMGKGLGTDEIAGAMGRLGIAINPPLSGLQRQAG